MEQLQNTLNIVHENFMVLYYVFVAFVGLNNNTEQYTHNIGFGSVSLNDTRSKENDRIGANTDPEYRIDASLLKSWVKTAENLKCSFSIKGINRKHLWLILILHNILFILYFWSNEHSHEKKETFKNS